MTYTPTPEQREAWDATLAWLDAGGESAPGPLAPLGFNMNQSWHGFEPYNHEPPKCGSTACIGGFIQAWRWLIKGHDQARLEPFAISAGEWLGMSYNQVRDLFYDWDTGDPHEAARRIREFLGDPT